MRSLLLLLLTVCSSACMAGEYFVEKYTGTDDQRLDKALADAAKDKAAKVNFGYRFWTFTQPHVCQSVDLIYSKIDFQAAGLWYQITYTGEDYFLTLKNWKDSSINKLRMRILGSKGSCIRILTDGSSSRNDIEEFRCNGGDTGVLFEAVGNADLSFTSVRNSEVSGAVTGWKWVGPNNLGPRLDNVNATNCIVGFDLRQGGSGARVSGCGGSYTKTLFWLNGGYQFMSWANESEGCDYAYVIGGDTAGGYGQLTQIKIDDMEHRSLVKGFAQVNKSGETTLGCLHLTGATDISGENRNDIPGTLVLGGAAKSSPKHLVGAWNTSIAD